MTTIAFDGKVLAGDTSWSENSVRIITRTKIERFPSGCLYGAGGHSDDRGLRDILKKVRKPSQLPSLDDLTKIKNDLVALLVFSDGKAFLIECSNKAPENADGAIGVMQCDVPCAIGSGRNFALSAMDAGATAYEAVKIACKRDINSGEPVTRLTLNPAPGKR